MNELLLRRRALMMAQKKSRLPSAYQEVEYLESTGTQYIITDIPIQSPIWIKADVMIIYGGNNDYALVCTGYRNASGGVATRIGMGWYRYRPQNYYRTYYLINDVYVDMNTRYSNVFYGEEGLQRQWLNGVELTPTNYATESAYLPIDSSRITFYIFAEGRENNGTKNAVFKAYARIYDVTIANNVATLGKFIPCVRKSDQKPGMYDLVTKTFFTNAGTGEFLVGPDVN